MGGWRCVRKFLLPDGPMLTKEEKIVKNQKSKFVKREQNGMQIWWIATFPQTVALIHWMVSEKTHFSDVLLRMDACTMALALLTVHHS